MIECAVGHFFLQILVGKFKGLDVLGTVKMGVPVFLDSIDEYDVEYAAMSVRIYGICA